MRGTIVRSMLLAFLAACGGRYRGPEVPTVYDNMDATHRVDLPLGHGSAVVLTSDGYLLTCLHVSGKGKDPMLVNISVGDGDPTAYPARVVAWDEKRDLAVIKVDRRFERTVILADADEAHPLDDIYNIGFPYDLGEMAGRGSIKAVHYTSDAFGVKNVILADIADGPGTSGSGVYLTRNGKLIGLMRALLVRAPLDERGDQIIDGRETVVRVLIGVDDIRAFLDGVGVPYRTVAPVAMAGSASEASGAPDLERVEIRIVTLAR